jgi:predicted dinucleotide-binding enzyme
MTRILVVGAGNVGRALGLGWLGQGHDVRFGVRDPSKPKYQGIPAGRLHPADRLGDAEVIVIATPSTAAGQAVTALGDLTGRIIIDCTNAVGHGAGSMTWAPPPRGGLRSWLQRATLLDVCRDRIGVRGTMIDDEC